PVLRTSAPTLIDRTASSFSIFSIDVSIGPSGFRLLIQGLNPPARSSRDGPRRLHNDTNSYTLEKHFILTFVSLRIVPPFLTFKEVSMKTMRRNSLFALFTALFVIGLVQVGHAAEKKERKILPALEAPAGSSGKKDWKEAEKHFREAVKSDDKLAEAHYNLGLALDKTGQHKEAGQEFD